MLSREIRPEEMASLPVVLTQMHNFIKSNNAQPIGPIIQSFALGEDHQMHLYMMQQATQLIPQMDPGYHMDAILRVKNCLYAHYTGPMENSLLAFAGANLGNEGLMTAAEIATMNLRQCELVVLSACETGLGKLSEDGVFGLQRGFKNAGVRTLLMSLKKVYDSSTADLMTFFYKYLMEGSTKREALIKAQQDVRASGYTDPAYWATFILLDAY